jgi:hypothetical protein
MCVNPDQEFSSTSQFLNRFVERGALNPLFVVQKRNPVIRCRKRLNDVPGSVGAPAICDHNPQRDAVRFVEELARYRPYVRSLVKTGDDRKHRRLRWISLSARHCSVFSR